jgi:hypothetical protein
MVSLLSRFLILVCVGLASVSVFAYIPPYWMVLSRLADNHGKGHYQIDQDIAFEHTGETLKVRERWFIEDEDNFRLEAIGLGPLREKLRLTYVYNNGRRYYVDANGIKKFVKIPDEFFEPYLHFRRSKVIKPRLVAQKIVPPVTLKSENHKFTEKTPLASEESFMRLSRAGGVVTYTVGEPTPNDSDKGNPGIWIEQDQFHLRRLRFPSGTEIRANAYQKAPRDAWFPHELQIQWDGQRITGTVSKVSALNSSKSIKELFDSSSLNFGKDPKVSVALPDDPVISNFYQSLR